MKKFIVPFCLLFLPTMSFAEHTRVTNPSALSVEVLGKGLLYSLQFDQVVNDDLLAGIGFGSVGLKTASGIETGLKTELIPVYMHYYFSRDHGSFYGELGATIVTDSAAANTLTSTSGGLKFNSNGVMPTIGLGFEERRDNGILFRVGAYGLIAQEYTPWFGFTLGYCF